MDREMFLDYYRRRGFADELAAQAVVSVEAMETWARAWGWTLEGISRTAVQEYLDLLVDSGGNDLETLLALARYLYLVGNQDSYVYFTSVLGGLEVMDSIRERSRNVLGDRKTDEIFAKHQEPPLGSAPAAYPPFTAGFVKDLQNNAGEDSLRKILAGNNHRIPAEAFNQEKESFAQEAELDEYLRKLHERKVAVLQEHCDAGKIWFEQIITQGVVDHVKGNQEILSAVRRGNKLFMTKIPYDTLAFLKAGDEADRRYNACHCTFARESIRKGGSDVPGNWCYCSAGFEKFPFEVLFGEPLEVEVLENVLDGDLRCRFAVTIPERIMAEKVR